MENVALLQLMSYSSTNGYTSAWKMSSDLLWPQYRMYARQLLEAYSMAPIFVRNTLSQPYGCDSGNGDFAVDPNPTLYKCVTNRVNNRVLPLHDHRILPRSVIHDSIQGII